MSGTNPVFLVRKAKKSSGQKDAVLWCSDDFEAANATLDYLLIKSGAKLKDYFKAVATNFPVVNELPPEGELSLTFCDYYQLAKDNMTWTQKDLLIFRTPLPKRRKAPTCCVSQK
ncbi:RecE family exodeoxyribonuclease, partial [Salmonella enterica]|uniref:RecE family exodeoxyribonuclease n=1 Tax=Salmonella enterica TaxID=28901 RepID=UPI003906331A